VPIWALVLGRLSVSFVNVSSHWPASLRLVAQARPCVCEWLCYAEAHDNVSSASAVHQWRPRNGGGSLESLDACRRAAGEAFAGSGSNPCKQLNRLLRASQRFGSWGAMEFAHSTVDSMLTDWHLIGDASAVDSMLTDWRRAEAHHDQDECQRNSLWRDDGNCRNAGTEGEAIDPCYLWTCDLCFQSTKFCALADLTPHLKQETDRNRIWENVPRPPSSGAAVRSSS